MVELFFLLVKTKIVSKDRKKKIYIFFLCSYVYHQDLSSKSLDLPILCSSFFHKDFLKKKKIVLLSMRVNTIPIVHPGVIFLKKSHFCKIEKKCSSTPELISNLFQLMFNFKFKFVSTPSLHCNLFYLIQYIFIKNT